MMNRLRLTVLVVLVTAAVDCDPSGGERGLYQPDMTWGPGSNLLYSTLEDDVVGQFCEHVHVLCGEQPASYEDCLDSWEGDAQYCPTETAELVQCMDSLYSCGDWESWAWWDFVSAACASEGLLLDQCLEPYYWD